jgi:hypothetical protein
MANIVFDIDINGLDFPLINLKIDKVLKFDKVTISMTEIHFGGLENKEDRRFKFIFGCLGSQRKSMIEIILVGRSMDQIHLGVG